MPAPCLVTVGTDASMSAAARGLPPSAPFSLGLGPGTRDSGSAAASWQPVTRAVLQESPLAPAPSRCRRGQHSCCRLGEGACRGLSLKAAGPPGAEGGSSSRCRWVVARGRAPGPRRPLCLRGVGWEREGALALPRVPVPARPSHVTSVSSVRDRGGRGGYSEGSTARFGSRASAAWHVPGVKGMQADDRRQRGPQEGTSAGVFWGAFLKARLLRCQEVLLGPPSPSKPEACPRRARGGPSTVPSLCGPGRRGLGGGGRLPTLRCFKVQVPRDAWEVAVAQTRRV